MAAIMETQSFVDHPILYVGGSWILGQPLEQMVHVLVLEEDEFPPIRTFSSCFHTCLVFLLIVRKLTYVRYGDLIDVYVLFFVSGRLIKLHCRYFGRYSYMGYCHLSNFSPWSFSLWDSAGDASTMAAEKLKNISRYWREEYVQIMIVLLQQQSLSKWSLYFGFSCNIQVRQFLEAWFGTNGRWFCGVVECQWIGPPSLVTFHLGMAPQSFEEMLRLTENLSEKYVVGRGGSSTVYKCTLKNGHSIAIKKLLSCPQNIHEFENELNTLGNIKHRNIVCLRGYSMSAAGNFLFYDFMENGSLYDLLHGMYSFTNLLRRMRFIKFLNAYKKTGHSKPVTSSLFHRFLELGNGYKQMKLPLMMAGQVKKTKLDWNMRLKIALAAAQGLAYLHQDCKPQVVHRDVKSCNILLDSNMEAHLADFGIAKHIQPARTHTSTYVLGTIGYIDPEYAQTSRLNEKSDVYSYGIVLLELLMGKKAVEEEVNLLDWVCPFSTTANHAWPFTNSGWNSSDEYTAWLLIGSKQFTWLGHGLAGQIKDRQQKFDGCSWPSSTSNLPGCWPSWKSTETSIVVYEAESCSKAFHVWCLPGAWLSSPCCVSKIQGHITAVTWI